jgi:uncharacterized protein (DUF2235 family)
MKRIVICADGTWNIRDQIDKATGKRHATNVTKVARAVRPQAANGTNQIVYYHDGVGTRQGLDRVTGGAFGEGIEANIREIYRFLAYNYVTGDEIYLFGFSRGAFTVRTLAGFMNKLGLVEKGDDFCLPELYSCYENRLLEGTAEWVSAHKNIRTPRPCPPIRFVGVWDTVGALGAPGYLGQIINSKKYQYHDVALNPFIQNAIHALAVDERRQPFKPNLWTRPANWSGILEQAWFAGVHSNVGGGYVPDGMANEALHWMVEKAESLGLEFDDAFLRPFRPCFNSTLFDSMTAFYRPLGIYSRPIGLQLADGEKVHQSAIDRLNHAECYYAPINLIAAIRRMPGLPVINTVRIARGTPC